jgi:magnesium chelatase subunit D
MSKHIFPFTAITGQELAKKAVLLNLVCPKIGGVLLSGTKGTAKSTIARAAAELLPGCGIVELPLSVTEEALLGSIDIAKTLATGKIAATEGILAKANGKILYIDEANLLPESIGKLLLDAASAGCYTLERGGVSGKFQSNFTIIASINPEEGAMPPQILDRFGFLVELETETGIRKRIEIVKKRLSFDSSPHDFRLKYEDETLELAATILAASVSAGKLQFTDQAAEIIANICSTAAVAGYRADFAIMFGAIANAALDGRKTVSKADIELARSLALPHRIRNPKAEAQMPNSEGQSQEDSTQENSQADNGQEDSQQKTKPQSKGNEPMQNGEQMPGDTAPQDLPDSESGEQSPDIDPNNNGKENNAPEQQAGFCTMNLPTELVPTASIGKNSKAANGKRNKPKHFTTKGRTAKASSAKTITQGIDIVATIRAAAVMQVARPQSGLAINIAPEDIRGKRKKQKFGSLVLFALDCSGSMSARRGMEKAKSAVLELLKKSYAKRDTVSIISFGGRSAEIALPPTNCPQKALAVLQGLKNGGATPLSEALWLSANFIAEHLEVNPGAAACLVLVSDGRDTVDPNPLEGPLLTCRIYKKYRGADGGY